MPPAAIDDEVTENRNGKMPAWEKFMRDKGATDDEISEVRRENQREFTKARQKDRNEIAEIRREVQSIKAGGGNGQQQGQASNKMPWDQAFDEFPELGEKAPVLVKALAKAFANTVQSMMGVTQQITQQTVAPLAQTARANWLAQERQKLTAKYGEKRIAALWPDLESEIDSRAQRGEAIRSAEEVFRDSFEDDYRDAFFESEQTRRKAQNEQNKTRSSEGFTQTQRSQPMQIADSRPDTDEAVNLEKIMQDSVQEAMKEVGITL